MSAVGVEELELPEDPVAMAGEKPLHILLLEDSPSDAELVQIDLSEGLTGPFEVAVCSRLEDGLLRLATDEVDVLLLDLSLPDSSGMETFYAIHNHAVSVPVVVLTGADDETLAIRAVREGAQDYLVKGRIDGDSLGRAVRFSIERTRRRHAEAELRAAEEVQQRLYPPEAPRPTGFDISGMTYPAAVNCGDYFDFISADENATMAVVGDVSGHGLGPALLMVNTRAYLHAVNTLCRTAEMGSLLKHVNQLLCADRLFGRFVSLFVAWIDARQKTFRYASAGHRGYLLRQSGEWQRLESTGPVAGLLPQAEFSSGPSIVLQPGDIVFLPTDGLLETMSRQREMFGEERALEVLRAHRHKPAQQIVEAVYAAARAFAGTMPQKDDITMVLIKAEE